MLGRSSYCEGWCLDFREVEGNQEAETSFSVNHSQIASHHLQHPLYFKLVP
uniref:Uncharacterized protein n=1 Tax=Cucumis melo TaxID=3656 RepID=A0A9I9E9V9_CUCME